MRAALGAVKSGAGLVTLAAPAQSGWAAAAHAPEAMVRALEALQGERYLRLAEKRPANEAFLYGWLANRVGSDEVAG